ncbi:hypothetical protein [Agrobacterium sp. SORGH_AS 787]|uniref:hypothetical protein n=1 Tax=Agrobacterium sp. SORGH_AS 787 TaxID=3041775 RepID=UPI00277E3DB7|nr:hypothetical protein [Rhizobium sp. SORGH_AS_0787]
MATVHRLISLLISLAAPAATWAASGEIRFEFIVLGAILGIADWYWGPSGTLL